MSEYTTGELAKISKVSVRTLQYYDQKGLLVPSNKTSGGRRLYNATDYDKLKLILLLKNMGLKLNAIKDIINSKNSIKILRLLLDQQAKQIKDQVRDSNQQLKIIEAVQRDLPDYGNISLKSISDMNQIMNDKKALRRVHMNLLLAGIPIDILEIGTLIYAIMSGNWIPFIIAIVVVVIAAIFLSRYYFHNTMYICPNCNTKFVPSLKQAFWANHNIKARKLTCPHCGETNFCVEIYRNKKTNSTL